MVVCLLPLDTDQTRTLKMYIAEGACYMILGTHRGHNYLFFLGGRLYDLIYKEAVSQFHVAFL